MDSLINKNFTYAIVGVSEDKEKWGRKLFDRMSELGFKVIPVNPKYEKINEVKCYPNLSVIQEKIDVLITVVPPQITAGFIDEAIKLGIKKVWMQPGSDSDELAEKAKNSGIEVVTACFIVDGLKTTWNNHY